MGLLLRSRWNPLDSIWDMYQDYLDAGKGIKAHKDNMANYPDLKQMEEEDLLPLGDIVSEFEFSDPETGDIILNVPINVEDP